MQWVTAKSVFLGAAAAVAATAYGGIGLGAGIGALVFLAFMKW